MSKQIYKKSDKLLLLIPTVFLFFSLGIIPTVVIITACIHFITVVCIAVFTCKAGITAVIGIEVLRICIVISVIILVFVFSNYCNFDYLGYSDYSLRCNYRFRNSDRCFGYYNNYSAFGGRKTL